MKIIIIGGTGTIGKKVSAFFLEKHEVLIAGRSSADYKVDITDQESILSLFEKTGKVDAIVCVAGEARWASFESLSEEDYYIGIRSKMMGQINLVRIGSKYLNEGGSITLSTGILADDPVVMTASAAMVNGAIHSFVPAAQLELPAGQRLNAVSLGLVEDAYEKYKDYFPGHTPVSMEKSVNAYAKSVLGKGAGKIIRIYS